MDQDSTSSALQLFDQLVELPPENRLRWLDDHTGEIDPATRDELRSLLAAYDDAGEFLSDTPLTRRRDALDPHASGTRIDDYDLIELIGEGGFARVFRAQQTRPLRREVAVKIVKLGMDTRAVIGRFELERQALALMSHPNIAAVHDAGATETGRPYFVMELVRDGRRITQFCEENQLDIQQRLKLFIDVCLGMQHAHQKGVLHRDLKPSNILVNTVVGRSVPKIIDFGIAKAMDQQRLTDSTLAATQEQQLLGTPQYMSPEQARSGGVDVDTRSDIYSLGAVLYEMLAGRPPLDAPSGHSTALEQLQRLTSDVELPPPSTRADAERRRELRGELDWIVGKCVEKDRSRRYESSAALAADLQAYLEHRPITAAPPTAAYRARKFVRRNLAAVVAVSIILATLVAASIVSTTMAIRATRAQHLAQQRQEETKAVNDFLDEQIIGAASPYVMQGNRDMTLREALENASKNIAGKFEGRPLVEAAVRESIAGSYRRLFLPDQALPHSLRSWELRKQYLGPDDPDTLDSQSTYGAVLQQAHRLPEAEAIYKDLLERYRRVDPNDTLYSINALENYSNVVGLEGHYAEAETLGRSAAEKARAVLGADHAKTLAADSNYATLLFNMGKPADARRIWHDAYERSLRTQGPDNPDTMSLMSSDALALGALGRYGEAEPLYKESLERHRKVFGEDHPRTLMTLRSYGSVVYALGRRDEALAIYKETMETSAKVRHEDDPAHINAINDYAVTLLDNGHATEAEPLLKKVLELRRRAQGENHPMTILAMNTYGVTLATLGRNEEAEVLERQALEQRRRVMGNSHPHTVQSMSNYADVLQALHRDADAEPICAELFEKAQKVQIAPQQAAPYVAQYGLCLARLGKYEQAEAPLHEAYRRLSLTKQMNMRRARDVVSALAEVCDHTNRADQAAQFRDELKSLQAATRPAATQHVP